MTTCKHGTFVGGPSGPDYLCGACEDSADFSFEDHGSIVLVRPNTLAAMAWLEANVADEGEDMAQWFGGALVVEPRYVAALAEGIEAEGFRI